MYTTTPQIYRQLELNTREIILKATTLSDTQQRALYITTCLFMYTKDRESVECRFRTQHNYERQFKI